MQITLMEMWISVSVCASKLCPLVLSMSTMERLRERKKSEQQKSIRVFSLLFPAVFDHLSIFAIDWVDSNIHRKTHSRSNSYKVAHNTFTFTHLNFVWMKNERTLCDANEHWTGIALKGWLYGLHTYACTSMFYFSGERWKRERGSERRETLEKSQTE